MSIWRSERREERQQYQRGRTCSGLKVSLGRTPETFRTFSTYRVARLGPMVFWCFCRKQTRIRLFLVPASLRTAGLVLGGAAVRRAPSGIPVTQAVLTLKTRRLP